MVFASNIFIYAFLPLFLALYYATSQRGRAWVIALASYLFYGWWRPDFVALMWASTALDYSCGHGIARDRTRGRTGRRWVVLSCVANLSLLAYFKYANFGIDTLNHLLVELGARPLPWAAVILPVGISFYTFQTLSYTVDVYRRQAEPVESFRDFACYVALFPQLVAGPIVRYRSVAEQLRERSHTLAKFAAGVMLFLTGLTKKVLLADTLAVPADRAFSAEALSALEAWIGALAYTLQIYFDFSGYSDMAIGLGLMIGFQFPVNFDRPYTSRSITEFWRRWHISLSSFLRDYLYIPLGGNRRGPVRTYVNLGLTMLLGGLWHGAAWTFIAWGAYQGFWLIVERLAGQRALYASLPRALHVPSTMVIVVFGWVLFRAPSMPDALAYMGAMLGLGETAAMRGFGAGWVGLDRLQLAAFVVAPIVLYGFRTSQAQVERLRPAWCAAVACLAVIALVHLLRASHVPFLYFQF